MIYCRHFYYLEIEARCLMVGVFYCLVPFSVIAVPVLQCNCLVHSVVRHYNHTYYGGFLVAYGLFLCIDWSVPKACDKPFLPAVVSLVLAFILLELRHDLCHDCLLLHPESACLKLG
jgi:hypothetical protein